MMKKPKNKSYKCFCILLVFALLIPSFSIVIRAADEEKPLVWSITEDGVLTIESGSLYFRNDNDVPWNDKRDSITEIIFGEVEHIYPYQFNDIETLKKITLSHSIKTIAYEAFMNCTSLCEITLGDHILQIGPDAFSNTAVYNDDSNWEDGVLYVDNYLIKAKNDITSCTIKEGTRGIACKAFGFCDKLEAIEIPSTIEILTFGMFEYCSSLKKAVIGSEIIEGFAFNCCTSLEEVTLSNELESIGGNAFWGCKSLERIVIPEKVEVIGDLMFPYCYNLKEVVFNGKVIEDVVFEDCSSLSSISLGNNITTIGNAAFKGCASLKSIVIPETVNSMDKYAFWGFSKDFVIKGIKGSYAEEFALSSGFVFEAIDKNYFKDDDFYLNKSEGVMENLPEKTTAGTICQKLAERGIIATVSNSDNKEISFETKVGTGAIITDFNSNEYTVIIKGDVDGNGEITSTDYLQITKMFLGELKLDGAFLSAADSNVDGEITSTDYLQIKKYFLGEINLFD
jgi:hypothetical protein